MKATPFLRTRGAVFVSMLVALVLSGLPMPELWRASQPLWPVMVLLYWVLAMPDRIGYGVAVLLGLFMDVQQGALLGQNVFSLSIVVYLGGRFYKTMRLADLTTQAVVSGVVFTAYLLCNWLVSVATGSPPIHAYYWLPVVSSSALWPLVFLLLRNLRRRAVMP